MAETYKYATHLRSLTQGRGIHGFKISHYEEVPSHTAEQVIAKHKKDVGKEEEE